VAQQRFASGSRIGMQVGFVSPSEPGLDGLPLPMFRNNSICLRGGAEQQDAAPLNQPRPYRGTRAFL